MQMLQFIPVGLILILLIGGAQPAERGNSPISAAASTEGDSLYSITDEERRLPKGRIWITEAYNYRPSHI